MLDTALDDARRQNKTECVAMLEAAEAEAVALLRQAEEAAWKACGGPEALAAVAAAVEAGDREKAAAAQKVLEEVASAAGIAVSASFLYLHAAAFSSCHVHLCCSEAAQLLPVSPTFSSRRNTLRIAAARLPTSSSANLCPGSKLLASPLFFVSLGRREAKENCSLTQFVFCCVCYFVL